jgi:hypothetical protein
MLPENLLWYGLFCEKENKTNGRIRLAFAPTALSAVINLQNKHP